MVTSGLPPLPAPGFLAAPLPAGERLYAVGDVHGCADRLAAMHGAIAADLAASPAARATLVHLGDAIDRGPDSAGVIALLLAPWPHAAAPDVVVNLMGNHEAMLLEALANPGSGAPAHWLANGGAEALRSWGIGHRTPAAAWEEALPPAHRGFLRGLGLVHVAGGYVCVHAGLRPGRPLAAQSRDDMLWIRSSFLGSDDDLGHVVIHGHTPVDAPELRPNRIGIDTGAVLGGPLTCAVLEGATVRFLQS